MPCMKLYNVQILKMNRQILMLSRKGECLNMDPKDLSKSGEIGYHLWRKVSMTKL